MSCLFRKVELEGVRGRVRSRHSPHLTFGPSMKFCLIIRVFAITSLITCTTVDGAPIPGSIAVDSVDFSTQINTDRGAVRAFDGSAIEFNAGIGEYIHNPSDGFGRDEVWLSANNTVDAAGDVVAPTWLVANFAVIEQLGEALLFNYNVRNGSRNRGINGVNIYHATTITGPLGAFTPGNGWTQLTSFGGTFDIANQSGLPNGSSRGQVVDFGGVSAQHVAFEIQSSHDADGYVALGDVQFFAPVPEPGTASLLALAGLIGFLWIRRRQ